MGTEREGIPEGSFELDPASLATVSDDRGDVKGKLKIPEGVNKDKKQNPMNYSQCPTQEGTTEDLPRAKYKMHADLMPSKGRTPSSQEEFRNFKGEKSEGKFETGQIWALYDNEGMPKIYAQLKKVVSSPFRLHVDVLESCTVSKVRAHAVCCGTFKLQDGKSMLFSPVNFSHMLAADQLGKYEIVQVLEDDEQCIKITHLARRKGFKSVFGAPRSLRSSTGVMEIPRFELARFSHQIPAFKLTVEKDGRLTDCWELDPVAIPVGLQYSMRNFAFVAVTTAFPGILDDKDGLRAKRKFGI
ncbi:hypothetical protein Vadar_021086 [Vaccinium darrowii]|uniref:Uncharacterized protein n=1 Tax=Vaccinium darrowii TaxID=229202 RepID=A0ACB7XIY5_9ERIC|nr:hypothetical protein Vadar_021086 [Vaccinium darrowii]